MVQATSRNSGWLRTFIAVLVFGGVLDACASGEKIDTPVAVARIEVSSSSVSLNIGQSLALTAVAKSPAGNALTARAIQWITNAPQVVTVTSSGLLTAVSGGSATVVASAGTVTTNVLVNVSGAVRGIQVQPGSVSLLVGQSITFSAAVSADSGVPTTVTWSSTDASKVSVTSTGTVLALALTSGVSVCAKSSVNPNVSGCATVVVAPTSIALSAATANFTSTGFVAPVSQTVNVTNGGGGTLTGLSVGAISYSAGQPSGWLTATLNTTTAPATLTLQATPGAFPAGTYQATVPISSQVASNGTQTVTVALTTSAVFPSAALVSYYRLDETVGAALIDANGVNTGTNNGALIGQPGKLGKSYSFDGNGTTSSAYADLGFRPGGYSALTVQAWVKTSDTDGAVVISRNVSVVGTAQNVVIGLSVGGGRGLPTFFLGGTDSTVSATSVSDGTWHHLVGVFDGFTGRKALYVDGIAVVSAATSTTATSSIALNFVLGRDIVNVFDPARYLIGNIDEVGIWNRALTSAEILSLYNGGLALAKP